MEQDRTRRYLQSAVVPIIEQEGEPRVVLITSSRSTHTDIWGIPKGLVEPHLSPADSAAKEAWEEAGLRGDVDDTPIGFYEYQKWRGTCEVEVYLMRVQEILDEYPERQSRKRKIVDLKSASDLVENQDVASILAALP